MNDTHSNHGSGQLIPNASFGEYPNIDSRFVFDYRTSMEIMSLQNRAAKTEAQVGMVRDEHKALMAAIRNLRWWILGSLLVGISVMVAIAAYQATWLQHAINANEKTTAKQIEAMNKRFDDMDKRWQAINDGQQKRFEDQQKHNEEMLKIVSGRVDRIENKF